jgi:hypothetical protein
LGQDADGFGAARIDCVAITLVSQDGGEPVNDGLEAQRVAGGGSGNDQLQAMLGGPAEPDEPFLARRCGPPLGAVRVGLHDRGPSRVCNRPNDTVPKAAAIRSSTSAACATVSCLVA